MLVWSRKGEHCRLDVLHILYKAINFWPVGQLVSQYAGGTCIVSHSLIYLWQTATISPFNVTYFFSIFLEFKMGNILFHCGGA